MYDQIKDPDNVPLIWIHDYHLMLAATTIRQVAEEEDIPCKIGFFLHIPFPPWDMVKIFPWHDLVLQVNFLGISKSSLKPIFGRVSWVAILLASILRIIASTSSIVVRED